MSQLVIESGRAERHYWADLWRYRDLFFILAWRDITVRYKQTVIGVLWAVLRPLLTMIIFVVVFGMIANLPSEGVPYPVYVFAGTLTWTFFATAFAEAANSLLGNANLISKVYFPRLIMPAASVIVAGVDLLISSALLLMLMLWYGIYPSWHILALPFFILIGGAAAFGAGLLFGALNVKFRDFRLIIPFIVQFGLYVSPVGFGSPIVPEQYRLFFYFNPMAAVIDGFRWSISGGATQLDPAYLIISVAVTVCSCLLGAYYFRKSEKQFADVI